MVTSDLTCALAAKQPWWAGAYIKAGQRELSSQHRESSSVRERALGLESSRGEALSAKEESRREIGRRRKEKI